MSDEKVVGRGRLQLRQSGMHLILTEVGSDKSVRFRADEFVDTHVAIIVKVISFEKRKKRRSSPRL